MKRIPVSCRWDSPAWFHRMPDPHLASAVSANMVAGSVGWPTWGLLYHLIISSMVPGVEHAIVEIGGENGLTTVVLARALVDLGVNGRVTVVEILPHACDNILANVRLAGLEDRVHIVCADAIEWMPPGSVSFSGRSVSGSPTATGPASTRPG